MGDKWLLSASGTAKGMNLITYSRASAIGAAGAAMAAPLFGSS